MSNYVDITDLDSVSAHAADLFSDDVPRRYRDAVLANVSNQAIATWVEHACTWLGTYPDHVGNLVLLGNVGTGKTYAAWAALRQVVTTPYKPLPNKTLYRRVMYRATTHADLLASLRPRAGLDVEQALGRIIDAQILLLDDLGAIKQTEWSEEVTYRIINGRYNEAHPMIATSNLPPKDLRDVLGDRIVSRIIEGGTTVSMTGTDRRRHAA